MKKTGIYGALSTIGLMAGLAGSAAAQEDTFKIGIITFLSGQAAESFGVPALNGGKLLIDMMNKGDALPAPYNTKGFGGMKKLMPYWVTFLRVIVWPFHRSPMSLKHLPFYMTAARRVYLRTGSSNMFSAPQHMRQWITSALPAI
mgnify:CR=1 FL=1